IIVPVAQIDQPSRSRVLFAPEIGVWSELGSDVCSGTSQRDPEGVVTLLGHVFRAAVLISDVKECTLLVPVMVPVALGVIPMFECVSGDWVDQVTLNLVGIGEVEVACGRKDVGDVVANVQIAIDALGSARSATLVPHQHPTSEGVVAVLCLAPGRRERGVERRRADELAGRMVHVVILSDRPAPHGNRAPRWIMALRSVATDAVPGLERAVSVPGLEELGAG